MAAGQEAELLPAVLCCPATLDLIRKGSKAFIKCATDMAGMLSLYQGLCTDLNALPAPTPTDQKTEKPTDQEPEIPTVDDATQLLRSSASFRAVSDSTCKVLVNYSSVTDKSGSLDSVRCVFTS